MLPEAILKKGEIERKLKQRGASKLFAVGGRGDTERENMTIQRCIVAKKDERIRFGVTVLVY